MIDSKGFAGFLDQAERVTADTVWVPRHGEEGD
jgi:hypothetical protein